MLQFFRGLFVRHTWVELDEANRLCTICGRREQRDIDIELLGPNAWVCASRGDVERHFKPVKGYPVAQEVAQAPVPADKAMEMAQ